MYVINDVESGDRKTGVLGKPVVEFLGQLALTRKQVFGTGQLDQSDFRNLMTGAYTASQVTHWNGEVNNTVAQDTSMDLWPNATNLYDFTKKL